MKRNYLWHQNLAMTLSVVEFCEIISERIAKDCFEFSATVFEIQNSKRPRGQRCKEQWLSTKCSNLNNLHDTVFVGQRRPGRRYRFLWHGARTERSGCGAITMPGVRRRGVAPGNYYTPLFLNETTCFIAALIRRCLQHSSSEPDFEI